MMDFEAQGENEFDGADLAQAGGEGASPVAGVGSRVVLAADGQGVVVLPEGVTLEDIQVQGRDLVVLAADGASYVIPDGGISVPQIEVDGVAVPPLNLAALLLGNEPEPAAGPPQSSGGNFADPSGPLQNAFGLGDLLPYTELQFPLNEESEVIPGLVNRRPDISVEIDDSGVSVINAQDAVDEAGLPARGGEPAGSNSAADSEGTYGFINFSSPDGTSEVAINGVAITQVGQTFSTPLGVLTITSIADGRIGYSYTLTDNTTDPTSEDRFTITIADRDGDTAAATLRISIVDDVPTAADDTDTVPAGSHAVIGGNVITGQGTDSGAAGADTLGADGARVSAVANSSGQTVSGNGALVIQGTYGTLTLNGDGSYSYARAPGTPGGASDTFTYTLTDGDSDTSTATLTIEIGDAPATVISVPEVGDGTIVDESGLPERDNEAPGSAEPTDVETTTGTITFAAPDGVASVAINGVVITGAGQQIQLPEGTLTIVSYDPAGGTLEYSFTLADNTGGDTTQVELTVTVTDTDGDSDSEDFVITIVDDTPTAVDDAAAQGAENAPVVIDVFANDTPGADSVNLVSGVALVDGTLTGVGTVTYNNDGTFTYTPAPGEEGTVTFDYTITDGDGDTSTAIVTITLAADSTPTIDVVEAQGGAVVDEAGLPTGSDAAAASETTAGTIAITTGNDTVASLVIDGVDVTNGGAVTGAFGTLTVTVSGGVYSYSYTLTTNTSGDATQDVFTVTVTDSDGDSASAPLAVDIVDDVPTAADDVASPPEDTPVEIDVFANDVAGADGVDLVAGVALATAPAKGSVVYNGDGTFTYTPTPGEEGSDSFTYTITDGDGDTSTATVTITLAADSTPTIDVIEAQGGAVVDEAGLPTGSDAAADSETTTGTIAIATGNDTVASLVINGTDVTNGGTVTGVHGTLTVTISGGAYSYSYTLTGNTDGDDTEDLFTVTVTDSDGDSASAPLVIDIVDDVPTARADADSVSEDGALVADGNVLTGSGGTDANATDGVADTPGADGAVVTTTGSFAGLHGTLMLNSDGSYSYTLNNADTAVQGLSAGETLTEVFAYTIEDGDGDTSSATLTITISGSDDGVTITGLDAAGAEEVVDEDDLPDGSSPDAAALTQTGTFGISSPDGLDHVTIGGTQVVANGVFTAGQTASSAFGTVTITGFTPVLGADGSIIGGTFSYSYTLDDNTLTHPGAGQDSVTDSFAVTVTDTDGSSATASLDVQVIDDVPTAQADANNVGEGAVVAGNVLSNDEFGADGSAPGGAVTGVAAGSDTSNPVTGGIGGVIVGTYGTLTLSANGSYTYDGTPNSVPPGGATDTFVYTVTDGDGDTSTTTLTITLTDSGLAAADADALVDEAGLASGSDAASNSEVFSGAITPSGGTGPYIFALTSPAGGAYGSLVLNADGTYTYTLSSAYDGTTADNGANTEQGRDSFGYTVTDGNGNTTSGTILVDIIDDVPVAHDDAATQATENAPIVIGALANDVFGADGVATGDPASVSVATQPTYGTVTYDPGTGLFTYTPAAGAGSVSTTDSFTYTIVDGDGDSSTATVTLTLAADSQPVVEAVTAAVDDDALGGSALSTGGDIDANAGESPPSSSEAVFNGKIDVDFGADGGSVTLANLDGTAGQVGTEAVTYGWDEGSRTLTATGPRGAVFSVTLDPDGTYTVTLLNNVLHAAGSGEASAPAVVLNYRATDNDDGDTEDTGTLTITFNDDAPFATDDAKTVDEGGTVGGNVLTDGTPDEFGADGPDTLGGGVIGFAQGGTTAAAGGSIVTALGTLTLHADGSYTYVAKPNTITVDTADTFTYTIEDGDGDQSTATLTINVSAVTGTVSDDNVLVNEAGLDGIGSAAATDSETDAIGAITVTGGTQPYTYVITPPAGPVGTLTVNSNGTYSYTLNQPIDGPTIADGAQTLLNVESYGYEVYDANNNLIGSGNIVIDVIDDVPTAHDDAATQTAENAPIVIDALANDVFGADGVATGDPASVSVATQPTYGTVTYDSGTGLFTYAPGAGAGSVSTTDSFTYTIVDGDGDTSTATVTITLAADSTPTAAVASDLTVDEDGFGFANVDASPLQADPAETDSTESLTDAGSVVVSFGNDVPANPLAAFTLLDTAGLDGQLTALDGTPVTFALVGGVLVGSAGGTEVIRVTVTAAVPGPGAGQVTYSYSTQLSQPVKHTGQGEGSVVLSGISFQVTDSDGDQLPAAGTFSVTIVDDVPTAVDDSATQATEGASVTIDVFGNDVKGADGADAASVQLVPGSQVGGGTLTNNGDGTFTLVPLPGQTGTVTFQYRMTDGDGDTSTATATITLLADSTPTAAVASDLTVDEDGFGFANVDASPLQANPAETDSTESLADSGSVVVSFGNDVPANPLAAFTLLDTAGLDGQLTALDGTPVTFALVGGVLVGSAGGTEVIRVTVTAAVPGPGAGQVTYSYSTQLSQPVKHTGQGEGSAVLSGISFQVTDSDGDQLPAAGTFDVTIVDDVPTANDDANSVTEGLGNTTSGNVYGAASAGDAADTIGADGAAVGGAVTGARLGTEAGGGALTGVAGATVITGVYGDLTINPDGTYSYSLKTASIPPAVTSETFTYQITDGDGDTDLAELVIALNQDARIPDTAGDAQTVYEDGLADGQQHGADSETVTGSFTVDGNGEGYTLTLDGDAGGPVVIDSVGDFVTTSKGVLTITSISAPDAGGVVTYGYSYTLTAALAHTGQGEINPLTDTITMAVTDATGDSDASPASIVISIVDDVPTAIAPVDITSGLINVAGDSETRALDADGVTNNVGADQPGTLTFAHTNGDDSGFNFGGADVKLYASVDGTQLFGKAGAAADGTGGTLVFTVSLDQANNQYTFTLHQPVDNGSGTSFSDLSGGEAGNPTFKIIESSTATTTELLFTPVNAGSINSDNDDAAVDGQFINIQDPDAGLRIDFGQFTRILNGGGPADDQFSIVSHETVNGFRFTIDQISSGTTADVRLRAFDADNDSTMSGDAGDVADPIVLVKVYDAAGVLVGTFSRTNDGDPTTVDGNIGNYLGTRLDIVWAGDAVEVKDLGSRYSVEAWTANGYNRIEIQNSGVIGGAGSDDGKFSLSNFKIAVTQQGASVSTAFDLKLTDADGDSVTMTDAINVTVDPVTPVALDLDGDGVEFLGLAAGVAFNYGGGDTATAWVAPDDGLLARSTAAGLDIVFGDDAVGARTDLEGLRLAHDSNGDGRLTSEDNGWSAFGVWRDANSDGKADAGEFVSLADAGITSIDLISDGQEYYAAGGDVHVHGTATYTRADGSTGLAADAEFATGAGQKAAQRTAETVVTAAAAGALLMPEPVLAHDQRATADEPLQRVDAGLFDLEAQDAARFARDSDLPTRTDLFDPARQVQPESAETTADHPAEDFAPTVADAAPEAHPGSDTPGSASEPVADFGGSAFTGFQGDAGGAAIMDALLALQAAPAQTAASSDAPANPAVAEALSEVADGAAVEAIVDHYAGGETAGLASSGGEIDTAVLLQALDGHVYHGGNGAVVPDAMEDAAMMAAAVQA